MCLWMVLPPGWPGLRGEVEALRRSLPVGVRGTAARTMLHWNRQDDGTPHLIYVTYQPTGIAVACGSAFGDSAWTMIP